MIESTRLRPFLLFATLLLCCAADSIAQVPGVTREQMWYAPTAEDWKKPVLIQFQRTWEDAVAVSQETKKPILVCVNMDGEIASEHYAGVRYRMPEIAKLYEPYVCVIASTYRHNPRDHDDQGNRILCPRFGSCTCGEHIAIEPLLFEKFMDGRRIAPRHIMVELDGKETYDVFYAFDTDSVFKAIKDGIGNRTIQAEPIVRGDRPILERVQSRDIQDRMAVEQAFRDGDAQARKALIEAAGKNIDKAPVDLLRLAVFGFDSNLSQGARQALAKSTSTEATELIGESLNVPMAAEERQALITALQRLGQDSPRARTLATVHQGLDGNQSAVDVSKWSSALEGAAYQPASESDLAAEFDKREAVRRSKPADPEARLAEAETALEYAANYQAPSTVNRKQVDAYRTLMFEDAYRAAVSAEQLGAKGWRVNAAIAIGAFNLGKYEEAYQRAEAGMGGLPADAGSWSAMSLLAIFAEARQEAIVKAIRNKEQWPPQYLTDVNAAYSVLARHPFGTDVHVGYHYDFVKVLGGRRQASRILETGLQRWPGSPLLHDRLRGALLGGGGPKALEASYEAMLQKPDAHADLTWFAGYASLVAAEQHRRNNNADQAVPAYDRAIAHFEQAAARNEASKTNSDHYVALALAGKARLAFEGGDAGAALDLLLAGIQRRAEATPALDGLNQSPGDLIRVLRAHFVTNKDEANLARLEAVVKALDRELLQLPAYERETPPPGQGGQGNQPRRRNG